jgi:hypothetical protein
MGIPLVRQVIVIVLVAAMPATACQRSQRSSGVSDSTFVATLAELKRVSDAPGMDSAQRAARRDSILQRRGLTSAHLEQAARDLAQNPARAQAAWQAIERRATDTTKAK